MCSFPPCGVLRGNHCFTQICSYNMEITQICSYNISTINISGGYKGTVPAAAGTEPFLTRLLFLNWHAVENQFQFILKNLETCSTAPKTLTSTAERI